MATEISIDSEDRQEDAVGSTNVSVTVTSESNHDNAHEQSGDEDRSGVDESDAWQAWFGIDGDRTDRDDDEDDGGSATSSVTVTINGEVIDLDAEEEEDDDDHFWFSRDDEEDDGFFSVDESDDWNDRLNSLRGNDDDDDDISGNSYIAPPSEQEAVQTLFVETDDTHFGDNDESEAFTQSLSSNRIQLNVAEEEQEEVGGGGDDWPRNEKGEYMVIEVDVRPGADIDLTTLVTIDAYVKDGELTYDQVVEQIAEVEQDLYVDVDISWGPQPDFIVTVKEDFDIDDDVRTDINVEDGLEVDAVLDVVQEVDAESDVSVLADIDADDSDGDGDGNILELMVHAGIDIDILQDLFSDVEVSWSDMLDA